MKSQRAQDIPIYDHSPSERGSFRTKVTNRIKRQMGGFVLLDADIAFESVATNPTPETLQAELAAFRETERTLGRPD